MRISSEYYATYKEISPFFIMQSTERYHLFFTHKNFEAELLPLISKKLEKVVSKNLKKLYAKKLEKVVDKFFS